jgi:hypothetical protein
MITSPTQVVHLLKALCKEGNGAAGFQPPQGKSRSGVISSIRLILPGVIAIRVSAVLTGKKHKKVMIFTM